MPSLLVEIGCEELPAAACREALAELPGLCRTHLGAEPLDVFIGPRRLAVVVEGVTREPPKEWVKGPPVTAPEQAREGFARRFGLGSEQLEERNGFLGVEIDGAPLEQQLAAIVQGIGFGKSMQWVTGGLRFARPVRWLLAKLDSETVRVEVEGVPSGSVTYGHRFTHGELEVAGAGAYLDTLRSAGVEPDQAERRRLIVEELDRLGGWSDPGGVLEEVAYLVESPVVLEGSFDERFLKLPERVVVTAMQSHQRYFPFGGARFAFVANGGDPEVVRAGNERVLEGRLEDAEFTFQRDVARGIEALAAELGRITFFAGQTYAWKTDQLVLKVQELGGDDIAAEAARLAKADQAAELVREFPDLEGHIGAEYARLAGYPEEVCRAIDEHYLPDGADAPLPSTKAGRILSAADKLHTLEVAIPTGHKPTGSRDPYGLRRAAIGLCRLAIEGGVSVPRLGSKSEIGIFIEERLEGLLDVPVEFVRAARASAAADLAGVAERARWLAALPAEHLEALHTIYTRASRIAGATQPAPWERKLLVEDAERELAGAIAELGDRLEDAAAAARLAEIVERFFVDVLVMAEDERLRTNRLRLLLELRDTVGRLGDLSQLPL